MDMIKQPFLIFTHAHKPTLDFFVNPFWSFLLTHLFPLHFFIAQLTTVLNDNTVNSVINWLNSLIFVSWLRENV